MKKIKIIAGAMLRAAFILAPGVAFGWWSWHKAQAVIALSAAAGAEFIWLLLFVFIAAFVQKWKERKAPEDPEDE